MFISSSIYLSNFCIHCPHHLGVIALGLRMWFDGSSWNSKSIVAALANLLLPEIFSTLDPELIALLTKLCNWILVPHKENIVGYTKMGIKMKEEFRTLKELITVNFGHNNYQQFKLVPLLMVQDGKAGRIITGTSCGGVYSCPLCLCHVSDYCNFISMIRMKSRTWQDCFSTVSNGATLFGYKRKPIWIDKDDTPENYNAEDECTEFLQIAFCCQHAIGGYSVLLFSSICSLLAPSIKVSFLNHIKVIIIHLHQLLSCIY